MDILEVMHDKVEALIWCANKVSHFIIKKKRINKEMVMIRGKIELLDKLNFFEIVNILFKHIA